MWRDGGREEYDFDGEFGYSYARRNTGNMQIVHVVCRVGWRVCVEVHRQSLQYGSV